MVPTNNMIAHLKDEQFEMRNEIKRRDETISGADVKIMDRFFRHRELPDSESFSKPGFQLKTA